MPIYKQVPIAEDANKKRLKELKAKKDAGKLTPAEQEEAINRILDYLGL